MRSIHSFLFLLAFSYTSAAQVVGTFETTGDMTTPRFLHGATRLLNGKVLIVGGPSFSAAFIGDRTVDLYDPAKAVFTVVGSTTIAGGGIPALLHDGRVLLIGADASLGTSAELYDPSTGTLTMTVNRTMAGGRLSTPLDDGRVLIMGGGASGTRAELYDPSTQTFAPTNDTQGIPQTATSLANGKVLVTWNYWDGESAFVRGAALFDPSTSVFASIEPTLTYHAFPTATLLMSGKVLIVGGDVGDGDGPSKRAEIYDPATDTFTATGNLIIPRENHTATLLHDGSVLIAGGHNSGPGCCDNLTAVELYDPVTGTFRSTGSLAIGRDNHVATLLENGEVLVTGGAEYYPNSAGSREPSVGVLASAERYVPSVVMPVSIVSGLRLDRTNVVAGSSYSVEVSGSNLTSETFFDIRFTSPGISRSAVVLNWQTGFAGTHDVPAGIASGKWTISGVRAHEIETDHTGSFVPVSAAITVLP